MAADALPTDPQMPVVDPVACVADQQVILTAAVVVFGRIDVVRQFVQGLLGLTRAEQPGREFLDAISQRRRNGRFW